MPAHRAWALEILNGVQDRFSDEEVLKKMQKQFAQHELNAERNLRLSAVETAILDLERRRARCIQTGNATELKAMLAPEFVAVAANSSNLTREEYINAAAAPNAHERPDYPSEVLRIDEGTQSYVAFAKMARAAVKYMVKYEHRRDGWVIMKQVPWPYDEPFVRFRTSLPSEFPRQ